MRNILLLATMMTLAIGCGGSSGGTVIRPKLDGGTADLAMTQQPMPDLAMAPQPKPDLAMANTAPCADPNSQACSDCYMNAQGMGGACEKYLNDCATEMDSGGMTGCPNTIACINKCADNTCFTNCLSKATAAAKTTIQQLVTCLQTTCPNK